MGREMEEFTSLLQKLGPVSEWLDLLGNRSPDELSEREMAEMLSKFVTQLEGMREFAVAARFGRVICSDSLVTATDTVEELVFCLGRRARQLQAYKEDCASQRSCLI